MRNGGQKVPDIAQLVRRPSGDKGLRHTRRRTLRRRGKFTVADGKNGETLRTPGAMFQRLNSDSVNRLVDARKGKDKNSRDGKGAGKGAGKKGEGTKGFAPLPPPPAPVQLATPAQTPAPSAPPAPTMAEQHLSALVLALQSQKADLPPTVLQALEGIAQTNAGAEAKDLHRAVQQQTKAKKELAKVRAQRQSCMSAWAQYLRDVTETVTKQMDAQKEAIQKLEDAELQWAEALQSASAELGRLSKVTDTIAELPAEDPLAESAAALEAQNRKRKALELEQQQQLLASLNAASFSADSMAQAAKREGSRTPRRQRVAQESMAVSSSPELAKDQAGVADDGQGHGTDESKPFA